MSSQWSEEPLRIVQTNLQVKDTDAIEPERLAAQIDDLGGNALVFNVGGIYAWYDTEVPYHTQNPHLPDDRDLLAEVIRACHDRDIRVIGRVDFSKADDGVYSHNPEWFARDQDLEPKTIGAERPGEWTILRYTCTNSAYRKEAVAIPVLEELLSRYDLDCLFYNAPGYVECHCDTCRRKYEEVYNEPLPDGPDDFREDWPERCVQDNMQRRYEVINDIDPEVQTILYYHSDGSNLTRRAATTDMICTESQNVLSRGHEDLPRKWKPARTMKVANTIEDGPEPVGIIHASPGMDWRHVGLPPAEYRFWLSQIPANNGNIWHTLTGIPDTIRDDRLLEVVGDVNRKIKQVEPYMAEATSAARTALLWDGSEESHGLFSGLTQRQIPFDLLLPEQASADRLEAYELVVVPADWEYTDEFVRTLRRYVTQGGNVLVEGDLPDDADDLFATLGVAGNTHVGDDLVSTYSRFTNPDETDNPLQRGMEETELVPHRGRVAYCDPIDDAESLLTLVPKWSPLEAVGRPPERASLYVEETEIPMAIAGSNGQTLYFPFALSRLLDTHRLETHYRLLENAVDYLLDDQRFLEVTPHQGLQVTPFETDEGFLLHLVNGVGERPLVTNTPVPEVDIELTIDEGADVTSVRSLISDDEVGFEQDGETVSFTAPSTDVWETLLVRTQ